jgi:hypothetical protein
MNEPTIDVEALRLKPHELHPVTEVVCTKEADDEVWDDERREEEAQIIADEELSGEPREDEPFRDPAVCTHPDGTEFLEPTDDWHTWFCVDCQTWYTPGPEQENS